jgi:hypothetical protein
MECTFKPFGFRIIDFFSDNQINKKTATNAAVHKKIIPGMWLFIQTEESVG